MKKIIFVILFCFVLQLILMGTVIGGSENISLIENDISLMEKENLSLEKQIANLSSCSSILQAEKNLNKEIALNR